MTVSSIKARSALSITNMLSKEQRPAVSAASCAAREDAPLCEPVVQEELAKAWERLCETSQREKRIGLHTAMNAADVRIGQDFVIEIAVSSTAAAHELEENMLDILDRLRTVLRNTKLTHRITVDESVRERLPYTPREKYEYLKLKNPLLKRMRNELDLNIDF